MLAQRVQLLVDGRVRGLEAVRELALRSQHRLELRLQRGLAVRQLAAQRAAAEATWGQRARFVCRSPRVRE